MTIGGIGLGFAGVAVMVFSDKTLGTWPVIMGYIIVYGIGRGVYENTNKAVIVDFFNHNGSNTNNDYSSSNSSSDSNSNSNSISSNIGMNRSKKNNVTAAFAATNFARNFASAFGYFAFNHISRFEMSLLVFLFAVIGVLCYYVGHARHQAYIRKKQDDWLLSETSSDVLIGS